MTSNFKQKSYENPKQILKKHQFIITWLSRVFSVTHFHLGFKTVSAHDFMETMTRSTSNLQKSAINFSLENLQLKSTTYTPPARHKRTKTSTSTPSQANMLQHTLYRCPSLQPQSSPHRRAPGGPTPHTHHRLPPIHINTSTLTFNRTFTTPSSQPIPAVLGSESASTKSPPHPHTHITQDTSPSTAAHQL